MLPEQRRREILRLIREEGAAKVTDLKELFNVTEPTIRQDLFKLEEEGHVVRQYGGAYLKAGAGLFPAGAHGANLDKKARIAAKAVEFIEDGDSLILDAGTTTEEIAKRLVGLSSLNVITPALNIALLLGSRFDIQITLVGGELVPQNRAVSGEQAAKFFDNSIVAGKFFLGAAGISDDGVVTFPGVSDIPPRKAMLKAAHQVFLVADSSKLGKVSMAALCGMEAVHCLITDSDAEPGHVHALRARGVDVLLA